GSRRPPGPHEGSSGSLPSPLPRRKSSPSSSSSSRSRKNHTSHTTRAPTSKTRRPTMKIHPSRDTAIGRVGESPRRRQEPILDKLASDREAGRELERTAGVAGRSPPGIVVLGGRPFELFAAEPAGVLELLVGDPRLAAEPRRAEAEHQRGRERPRLRSDVARPPDGDARLLA